MILICSNKHCSLLYLLKCNGIIDNIREPNDSIFYPFVRATIVQKMLLLNRF